MSEEVQARPVSSFVSDYFKAYEAKHDARQSGKPLGVVSGFRTLDASLGGYLHIGRHFILGQPGAGKTALAIQMASQCKAPAVFVTCELQPTTVLERLIACTTNTNIIHLESGEMNPRDVYTLLQRVAKHCPDFWIADGTSRYISHENIQNLVYAARGGSEGHCFVVIDSLHSWAGSSIETSSRQATEYELLSEHLNYTKQVASVCRVPVLLMSERNRESKGTPSQHAAKGHGGIEYAAETMLDLTVEEEGLNGIASVNLWIEKNRHGKRRSFHAKTQHPIRFRYDQNVQRFYEVDERAEEF